MEKIKKLWGDLSKKAKLFVLAFMAIIIWAIVYNWF